MEPSVAILCLWEYSAVRKQEQLKWVSFVSLRIVFWLLYENCLQITYGVIQLSRVTLITFRALAPFPGCLRFTLNCRVPKVVSLIKCQVPFSIFPENKGVKSSISSAKFSDHLMKAPFSHNADNFGHAQLNGIFNCPLASNGTWVKIKPTSTHLECTGMARRGGTMIEVIYYGSQIAIPSHFLLS